MMIIKPALIALAVSLSVTATADPFRFEVGGGYSQVGDRDAFSIGGSFYLSAIDTNKGPWGEAEFLSRASVVDLVYTRVDGGDDLINMDGRFVHQPTGWLLDLGYQRASLTAFGENIDLDIFTIGGGKYIAENSLVTVSYSNTSSDNFGPFNDSVDTDRYTVAASHLMDLATDMALRLDGSVSFADFATGGDAKTLTLGATAYLSRQLGIGVEGVYEDDDFDDDLDGSAFAEWYISPLSAVRVTLREGGDISVTGSSRF